MYQQWECMPSCALSFIKRRSAVSFYPFIKADHEGAQFISRAVSTSRQGAGAPLWLVTCHQPTSVPAQDCGILPQASHSCRVLKCSVLSPQGRPSPHRKLKAWWKWWRSCRKVICFLYNWGSDRSGFNSRPHSSQPWEINSCTLTCKT